MSPFPKSVARADGAAPLALVTGGCGFLGRNLVRSLLVHGYRVVVLDNESTGKRHQLPIDSRITFIHGDIMNPSDCALAAQGADLVFHLAAIVGMRLAVGDHDLSYRLADEGTANVLAATGDLPIVLFSSSAVYGLTSRIAVKESDEVGEQGALDYDGQVPGYAVGKWRLEQLGQAEAKRGRPVLIIRPFNAFGEGQTGEYGMVVPTFVKLAVARRPLTIYGDGTQSRTFSEVTTFAKCLTTLIQRDDVWAPPLNVINIGSKESTTILDLARVISAEAGTPLNYVLKPYEDAFPGHSDVQARVPDCARLESLIGEVAWPRLRSVVRELVSGAQVPSESEAEAAYTVLV